MRNPLTLWRNVAPVIDPSRWDAFGDHLSVAELCEIFRKTRPTVWRWLAQGVIPAHQIPGAASPGTWIVFTEEVRRKIDQPESPVLLPTQLMATFPDDLLTVRELSRLFGKTIPIVYGWLERSAIPGTFFGSRWYVRKDEIAAALEATSNQHNQRRSLT